METKTCELCPLNLVKAGVAVRVRQLTANPDVAHRLRELGLGEEQVVCLLNAGVNVICLVCNARLALSQEVAAHILVEPVTAGRPA